MLIWWGEDPYLPLKNCSGRNVKYLVNISKYIWKRFEISKRTLSSAPVHVIMNGWLNTYLPVLKAMSESEVQNVYVVVDNCVLVKAEALAKICEEHSLEIVDFFKEPDTPPSRDTLRKIEEIEYLILEETYNKNVPGG